jgi:hypothetical protein
LWIDVAGIRGDHAACRIDAADRGSDHVFAKHEELVVGTERDLIRQVKLGAGRKASVAAEPAETGAGDGAQRAVELHAAHAIVFAIGDHHPALSIDQDRGRRTKLRLCGEQRVTVVAAGAGAGDGADRAGRELQLAHAMRGAFDEVEIAGGVEGQTHRRRQTFGDAED